MNKVNKGDVIHHNTTTTFKFTDRVRILFGSKVTVQSEIQCTNEVVEVIGSSSETYVPNIFKRKRKQKGIEMIMLSEEE